MQVKHPVIDWHFYLRLFHMFISQSVKLISDNFWIGLVLWHRLDVYNQKLSIHNKCACVGIHQWLWKVHKGSVLSIELFVYGFLHLGTKTFIRDNRNFNSSEFNSTGVKLYIFIHNFYLRLFHMFISQSVIN
jgi:hypothetical protein